jgi:hypothetical protein
MQSRSVISSTGGENRLNFQRAPEPFAGRLVIPLSKAVPKTAKDKDASNTLKSAGGVFAFRLAFPPVFGSGTATSMPLPRS